MKSRKIVFVAWFTKDHSDFSKFSVLISIICQCVSEGDINE